VFLLAVTLTGALYEPNTAIPVGFLGKHVTVHGIPIRVLSQGSGRDLLLIHGSPGSIEDWASVIDELSKTFRVTAFDRPGNGFSGDAGEYSPSYNAEIALGLIDELKLDHTIVAGHSYGGATALAMALRAPRRVAAYVIIDSATYRGAREVTPLYSVLHIPYLGIGLASVGPSTVAAQKIRAGLLDVYKGHAPAEAFLALRERLWSAPKVAHAIAEETIGATPALQKLSPRYKTIRAPVYILAQAEDPFRREAAQRLHSEIKGSSLELLPATSHYVQFDRPADVVATIRRAAADTAPSAVRTREVPAGP